MPRGVRGPDLKPRKRRGRTRIVQEAIREMPRSRRERDSIEVKERCPKCSHEWLRVHGTQVQVTWRDGELVMRTVAVELSCGECLWAFISTPEGVVAAPRQEAYDGLRAAREAVALRSRAPAADGEPPRPMIPREPRLAPDPRVRRRE